MKKSIYTVIVLLFVLSIQLNAQVKLVYSYDASGNRVEKRFHVGGQMKSAPAGSELYEQSSEKKLVETLAETKITIYPNPTDAKVKVQIENLSEHFATKLYVYDIRGIIILNMSPLSELNNIDLTNYLPGIYFLKIKGRLLSKEFSIRLIEGCAVMVRSL